MVSHFCLSCAPCCISSSNSSFAFKTISILLRSDSENYGRLSKIIGQYMICLFQISDTEDSVMNIKLNFLLWFCSSFLHHVYSRVLQLILESRSKYFYVQFFLGSWTKNIWTFERTFLSVKLAMVGFSSDPVLESLSWSVSLWKWLSK